MKKIALALFTLTCTFAMTSCANTQKKIAKSGKENDCQCHSGCLCNQEGQNSHCGCSSNSRD